MTTLLQVTYGNDRTVYLRDWHYVGEFVCGTHTDEHGFLVIEEGCRGAELWIAQRRVKAAVEVEAVRP